MRIRSITCLINPGWPLDQLILERAGSLISSARPVFGSAGYEVQTARLATVPFPAILPDPEQDQLIQLASTLQEAAGRLGIDYVSLGPASPDSLKHYHLIPAALKAASNVFFSGLMTTADGGISLPAVRRCAEVIHAAANLSPDGFSNLRFAALANVPPGGSFFPAAYARPGRPAFTLALEAAGLAVQAALTSQSLAELRSNLIEAVESHAARLTEICRVLVEQHEFDFAGFDFSLAPFPTEDLSLGAALEKIGVPAVGLHGSLTAAAILTDALDSANFARAGFNGLFLPVLEDGILAQRAAEGSLTVKDLLLFSTVCGTGLDTVPLPGDLTVDQIFALLLDLSAVASRLRKPLTARLMPIPGKQASDPVAFDFPFFASSRVMSVQAQPLEGLFKTDEVFHIKPRP